MTEHKFTDVDGIVYIGMTDPIEQKIMICSEGNKEVILELDGKNLAKMFWLIDEALDILEKK